VKSILAGALALAIVTQSGPAACATTQAAAPFPVVPVADHGRNPHRAAYLCLGAGVALAAGSFAIARDADRTYDRYLVESDPARIEGLYDHTVHLDHWSRATLLGGHSLIIAGLYLRFLRHPPEHGVSWLVAPDRCALTLRF
jgi:hypothetical protein